MPKATQSWQFQNIKCRDEIGPIVCSSENQLVLTKIPISQYILECLRQFLPRVVYEQWHCIKANRLQGPLITNEVNSETQVWVLSCTCPEISCTSNSAWASHAFPLLLCTTWEALALQSAFWKEAGTLNPV